MGVEIRLAIPSPSFVAWPNPRGYGKPYPYNWGKILPSARAGFLTKSKTLSIIFSTLILLFFLNFII
jgi:hypothetical protein